MEVYFLLPFSPRNHFPPTPFSPGSEERRRALVGSHPDMFGIDMKSGLSSSANLYPVDKALFYRLADATICDTCDIIIHFMVL